MFVRRSMGLSEEQVALAVLDDEIRLALQRNAEAIAEAERRIVRREGEYDLLLAEIREYEREHRRKMENKEKNIAILDGEVQRSEERAHQLEAEMKGKIAPRSERTSSRQR